METRVTNVSVDSSTPDMKESSRTLASAVIKGVVAGLVSGFLVAIWVAGSDWMGTMVAASLAIMGAAATIGGLVAANFAPE